MPRFASCSLLSCVLALLVAAPAFARGPSDDPDRQQRRMELRQQLEAERERWRADAPHRAEARRQAREYGGPMPGEPPAYAPMPPGQQRAPSGYAPSTPGYGPVPGYPRERGEWARPVPPPGYAPPGGPGWSEAGPHGAPGRLSPEERRALRQELRRQWP